MQLASRFAGRYASFELGYPAQIFRVKFRVAQALDLGVNALSCILVNTKKAAEVDGNTVHCCAARDLPFQRKVGRKRSQYWSRKFGEALAWLYRRYI